MSAILAINIGIEKMNLVDIKLAQDRRSGSIEGLVK
jgi:hypothetical protein